MSGRQVKILLAGGGMFVAAALLFARLGAIPLWDDEATTALFAQSVWRTGDTDVRVGHNIVAYQSGVEIRDGKNRVIPPLPFYLAAPFVGNAPGSALAARLPFALCGLATIGVIILWLARTGVCAGTWLAMLAGLLCNVSFLLFSRQCRYYAPVMLLSVISAYFYQFRDRGRLYLFGLITAGVLLLSANYLCYAGVMACLAVDYLMWGRRARAYPIGDILLFVAIQLAAVGAVVIFYNPFGVDIWNVPRQAWIVEKLTLFFWNWRDLNSNEFGAGLLIAMAAILGFFGRDRQARRAVTALTVYIAVVSVLTPQPVNLLSVAFVRYLVPVIPLCVWITVICVRYTATRHYVLAVVLAVLVFGTNILHGGPLVGTDPRTVFSSVIAQGKFRSTIAQYIGELIDPPPSAYGEMAQWINRHVGEGQSVWVTPGYATYPLMYHAPRALYAWQLEAGSGRFPGLPAIHFAGQQAPEFIVAFGPYRAQALAAMEKLKARGMSYREEGTVNRYWYDLIRPELFWHAFGEVREFSPDDEAVYLYRRQRP
ncbi:MAG: hypothetical protein KC900_05165 [Candidatus Omnitrophica bacterium]|nr:hypothetical protein [Candidatus Omnitrophota bacterium]